MLEVPVIEKDNSNIDTVHINIFIDTGKHSNIYKNIFPHLKTDPGSGSEHRGLIRVPGEKTMRMRSMQIRNTRVTVINYCLRKFKESKNLNWSV